MAGAGPPHPLRLDRGYAAPTTTAPVSIRSASLEMYPVMPSTEMSTAPTRELAESDQGGRVVWPEPSPLEEWWNRVMGATKASVR